MSITCPRCGLTSYNLNDVAQRYCGWCHKFHDEMKEGAVTKSQLWVKAHTVLAGQYVLEIWHEGNFIGTVTGADGPGVRVISTHRHEVKEAPPWPPLHVTEADGER